MNTEGNPQSDRELWQRYAGSRSVAPAAISDLDFAAWLEGRLSEDEAATIEAAVGADPELRRAALEIADVLGKPLPAPSPRLTVRAQALVGFEAERTGKHSWLGPLLAILGAGLALERSAMAGIAIVVAAVGFLMGGGLGESYAGQRHATTAARAANPFGVDTVNQLNDLFTDNS